MGCSPRGQGGRRPGTSIFGRQRSNRRKALRKRRAVVREAGMHRWRRASRPSCRAGTPGAPPAIFPPSLDLSYAMIPVSNYSRQPTTHSTIRPRWRIPHGRWSSKCHHWQIRNRNFEALYFLISRFISKFSPSDRWGRKHIAHRSLYISVPASGWFHGTAGVSNVFSDE
jgi:hypothetical protein